MLTGQLPFRGSVMNVLAQIIARDFTRPSELRPDVDPRIEALCLRMTAKKASDRFPSLKAVADEVTRSSKIRLRIPPPRENSRRPVSHLLLPFDPIKERASGILKSVKKQALTKSASCRWRNWPANVRRRSTSRRSRLSTGSLKVYGPIPLSAIEKSPQPGRRDQLFDLRDRRCGSHRGTA